MKKIAPPLVYILVGIISMPVIADEIVNDQGVYKQTKDHIVKPNVPPHKALIAAPIVSGKNQSPNKPVPKSIEKNNTTEGFPNPCYANKQPSWCD